MCKDIILSDKSYPLFDQIFSRDGREA